MYKERERAVREEMFRENADRGKNPRLSVSQIVIYRNNRSENPA